MRPNREAERQAAIGEELLGFHLGEKFLDAGAKAGVALAGRLEIGPAFVRVLQLAGRVKQFLLAVPGRVHVPGCRVSVDSGCPGEAYARARMLWSSQTFA